MNRALRKAAYKAGRVLYGDNLVYRSSDVLIRSISERVLSLLQNDTDPDVAGLVDDYEYAFTLDGAGIEASGDLLTNPALNTNGWVFLYDPDIGIDALKADITTEEMHKLIADHN